MEEDLRKKYKHTGTAYQNPPTAEESLGISFLKACSNALKLLNSFRVLHNSQYKVYVAMVITQNR